MFIVATNAKLIAMASPPLPLATATIFCRNSTSLTSTTSCTPFLTKKSRKPSLATNPNQGFVCKATNNDQNEDDTGKLDRRNMLIGLGAGGLYGTAGLNTNPFAFSAPVPPPDFETCSLTETPECKTINCCPPNTTTIIDFKPPDRPGPLRTRLAAQNVAKDPTYLAKYKKAVEIMRALPKDDPRNFNQQAMVHCAYCDGSYNYMYREKTRSSEVEIQVHGCWLFFPFHRWYLYFHEKILGNLINDPTFALPFWNWDAPAGMYLPSIFTDPKSSLYDQNRNAMHQPPKLIDLNYHCSDNEVDDETRIKDNLTTMYRQMISNSISPYLFFGQPYRAGGNPYPGAGNIENVPHDTVHDWTGDPNQPRGEDMGTLYSAARDPIFYCHHSNVDRMWSLYKARLHKTDITEDDYLNTEFLFYDENKNLVRVKVGDSLDESKLGYKYQDVDIPWLNTKPTARKSKNKRKADVSSAELASKFPAPLSGKISVEVMRPVRKRSLAEKKKEEEILVISGIEFAGSEKFMFDVYVNDDADVVSRKDKAEFAGSFVHMPLVSNKKIKTNLQLGLTDLLADLGAEEDRSVVVTLVPQFGKSKLITIGGLEIKFIATT